MHRERRRGVGMSLRADGDVAVRLAERNRRASSAPTARVSGGENRTVGTVLSAAGYPRSMSTGPRDGGGVARDSTVTDGFGFFFRVL